MGQFAVEFFWRSIRDLRAWIGIVGLVLAGANAVTGTTIIIPTWGWLLIAVAGAFSLAVRAEWKIYQDRVATITPDMKLVDVVKLIVGSDDILVGENCSKMGEALLTLRERAHLGAIAVWGRKNMLAEDTSLYPRVPIATDYWEDFGIEYLDFIRDMNGKTKRVRGEPKREVVPNITMHTQPVITIPDNIYSDL